MCIIYNLDISINRGFTLKCELCSKSLFKVKPKVKRNGRHRLVQELENLESACILQKLGKALKVVGKFDI